MEARQSKHHPQIVRPLVIATILLTLVAAGALAISAQPAAAAPSAVNYSQYADSGIVALQGWYNTSTGLWNTTNWWNAANALTAVIDYSQHTGSSAYLNAISNTYDRNRAGNFLNDYYDDEGWWALAWIEAYDLTGDVRYLNMAKTIFNDMTGGWDSVCGGGIWWSKARTYKNAIPNELFLTVAIRLHQRTPGDAGAGSYLDWAQREWNWFNASGMINSQNLVNDGLTSSCVNNGQTTWTYNQGVILGGLADLYKSTGNATYLSRAQSIADATIARLVTSQGILREPCEPSCGADGPQFKGIFMRNLAYLHETQNRQAYRDFIIRNADSIWLNDRNASNQFGLMWSGPFDTANAANQSSAQDALNAAIPYSDTTPTTGVIFYQDINYGGAASAPKAPGDYASLPADVPNDWMSSLRVPAGWTVDAYANGSFGGTVCTFTADTSWVGSACNDMMSSFRIRAAAPTATTPPPTPTRTPTRTPTPTTPTSNIALNRPVACSSIEGSGTPCAAAVDGSTGTRWSSAFSDPQWIRIDLGATYSLTSVTLRWETAYGQAFQIQASANASTWSTLYSTSTGTGGVQTIPLSGSGRYVRMYGTARATSWGYSLWEFEVYGSSSPAVTNTPVPTRTPTPGPATGVIFYQDVNYGGTASGLKGKGDYAVLPSDVPNDWMSSLRVPSGWAVEAYSDGGFGGTVCTFTADTAWVGSACNDRMSSFKIY